MAKKIFGVIATGIVLLLALFFAVVLLFQQREFFGTVIMWILFLCVAILFVFVIYLVFSRINDIMKESKNDESNLSERHIEKILATGSSSSVEMLLNEDEQAALEAASRKKEEMRQEEARLITIKKNDEFEAIKKEAAERERADWETTLAKPQQELEMKIDRIKQAENEALERANHMPDESDRRFAMGEYEALARAREEAENQLKIEVESYINVRMAAEEEEKRHFAMVELRKSQEMESVKRQAEAMDIARRRAAQAAATGVLQTPRINIATTAPPLANARASQYTAPTIPQHPGYVSAGLSTPAYTALGRPPQPTIGGPGARPIQATGGVPQRPYSGNVGTPIQRNTGVLGTYTPQAGAYNPAAGSGYIVPKSTGASQQFSSAGLRTVTQQTAAARAMGGSRPVYDTTQFNTAALANFQEMNAENREHTEYVPTTLPGAKPPAGK